MTDAAADFFACLIDAESGTGIKAAGIAVKATDTGRVLMLQRSYADPTDKARGKWEFPGGCVEGDEGPWDCAKREWQEEVGQELPSGRIAGSWTNGTYVGHLYFVPSEDSVPLFEDCAVINPDDPDRDGRESLAWMDPRLVADNVLTRDEVRKHTDWGLVNSKPHKSELAQAIGPNSGPSPIRMDFPANFPSNQECFPEGTVTLNTPDGMRDLRVIVADSPARRTLGLQYMPDLGDYDGMLLRWPGNTMATVHNANVAIPVTVVFFDGDGNYVDHADLEADDSRSVVPRGQHRYALEMHQDNATDAGPAWSLGLD